MKKSIITSVLLLASLISCNTTKQLSNEELDRISWSAFCKDFGYNELADRDNEQAINDYLDAWARLRVRGRGICKTRYHAKLLSHAQPVLQILQAVLQRHQRMLLHPAQPLR